MEVSLHFVLNYFIIFLKNWWWVFLPFLFWKPFSFLYRWWRIDSFLSQQKPVLLEIKLPKDVVKPVRAMEQVMASINAAIYQPPDPWEKWVDGQVQLSISFEIASIGGETHFYVRTWVPYRESVEASLYAQYPELEIKEVDDYTKYVPQNIPNKDWDLFAADYHLVKPDYFPIKTYTEFETEHEVTEEKRVDPVAALLEGMAKVKPGEQFWFQFVAEPIGDADELKFMGFVTTPGSLGVWLKKGEELRDKLAHRPEASKPAKPMIQEAAQILITGKVTEEEVKEERDIIPPEMKLTPGEREVLMAMEKKMSKPFFKTTVRFVYLGKREVWFKPNFRLAFSYFNGYTTSNLNALFPYGSGKTLTKVAKSWFLPVNLIRKRRLYLRCRKIFRNYVRRLSPFFPKHGGTAMLNVEEMASLFHFPGQEAAPAPGVSRIESKRGGVPPQLPTE